MTGLDPSTDRIIEIAVIITDGRLTPVDEGVEYIIRTPKAVLDAYVPLPFRLSFSSRLIRCRMAGWESGVPGNTGRRGSLQRV